MTSPTEYLTGPPTWSKRPGPTRVASSADASGGGRPAIAGKPAPVRRESPARPGAIGPAPESFEKGDIPL